MFALQSYMKHYEDPPIVRNITPIAGRILWAQLLSKRLQDSMDLFKQHSSVFQGPNGKKTVQKYNRVMQVLLEYEIVYHTGWLRTVNLVDEGTLTTSFQSPIHLINQRRY